jgi:hypothetical protein
VDGEPERDWEMVLIGLAGLNELLEPAAAAGGAGLADEERGGG